MIGVSGQILVHVSVSPDINEPVNTTQDQGLRLNDNSSLLEVAFDRACRLTEVVVNVICAQCRWVGNLTQRLNIANLFRI